MKILLAPTYDIAKEYADHNRVDATVEAEYGDKLVEGESLTLAHHGSRSNNPAPCNDPRAIKISNDATVLISHLDLDTLGGLMALQGKKPDDPDFWKAAEYIDVNGPHHIHELPQEIQDKLNAYYAFEKERRQLGGRPDREHVQDVTETVGRYTEGMDIILDDRDYSRDIDRQAELRDSVDDVGLSDEYAASVAWMTEREDKHNAMIDAGRKWEQEATKAVEDRLVSEDENVRVFSTNGPFCNGSYYSPSQKKIIPAVVSYNEKFGSITLSFADGGKDFSAKEIVQSLWGPEAGGRDGIAGSPRGKKMTREDLKEIYAKVSDIYKEKERQEDKNNVILSPLTKEENRSEEDRKRDRIEAEIKYYKKLVEQIPAINEKTLEDGYKDIFFNDALSPEKGEGSVGERAAVFLYVLNDKQASLNGDIITKAVGKAVLNIREYMSFDRIFDSDRRRNLEDFYELTGVDKTDAQYLMSLNNYDRLCITEQGNLESLARGSCVPTDQVFKKYMTEKVMEPDKSWLSEKLPERERKDISAVKAMALVNAIENTSADTKDIVERKILDKAQEDVDIYALENFDRAQLITYLNRDNAELPHRLRYEKDMLLSDKEAPKIEGFKKEYDRYIEQSAEGKPLEDHINKAKEIYRLIQNADAAGRYEEDERNDRYAALMRAVEMIRYEAINDGDSRTTSQADDLLGSISYHQTAQIPVAMKMADTETLADEEDIAKAMEDIRKGYPGDELKRDEAVATVLSAIDRDRNDESVFVKTVDRVLNEINEREKEGLGETEYAKFLIRTGQMTSEEYLITQRAAITPEEDIGMPEEVRALSDIPIDERIPEAQRKADEHNASLHRDNDDKRHRDDNEEERDEHSERGGI